MTTFSIDVGFNKMLVPHPATWLAALLSQGVSKLNTGGNPVAEARNLKVGDRIRLTAYDLTSKKAQTIQAMSVKVFLSRAKPEQELSPFKEGSEFSTFKIYKEDGHRSSRVFGSGACPAWIIDYDPSGTKFPNDQLLTGTSKNPFSFEVAHEGHFYYTILLSVTWAGDPVPKNFRVDPEMITTTDGSPPDSKRD